MFKDFFYRITLLHKPEARVLRYKNTASVIFLSILDCLFGGFIGETEFFVATENFKKSFFGCCLVCYILFWFTVVLVMFTKKSITVFAAWLNADTVFENPAAIADPID